MSKIKKKISIKKILYESSFYPGNIKVTLVPRADPL
jgi:uncharacterized protein YwbE